jgi:hypothetical protein
MKDIMTKRRIEQYEYLQGEIVLLENQIALAGSGTDIVTDYAKDYRTGHPKVITLRGYGSRSVPRLSKLLANKIAECDAVEKYIEAIDDSVTRQILTLKYIEGKTIPEAAQYVGYSERQAKRILSGFFERLAENKL